MKHLPVHWNEGLFLRPHHFQAWDRHWSELSQTSQRWDNPHGYGILEIDFSKEALGNHQFELLNLKARMRDGTLVVLDAGNQPDRIHLKQDLVSVPQPSADLEEAFKTETTVKIYLGVPKLKLGRENVNNSELGAPRFIEATSEVHDENRSGNEQELQFRQLNARLLLSTDDLTGYEVLPIAQVKRAGEHSATPQLDDTFIPPVHTIDAWPELGSGQVRAIYDIIGQKIDVLCQQVVDRGISRGSLDPGDADRVAMLERLNEAYSTLGVLAFSPGANPVTVYTELCRIAGQLAIFGSERRAIEVPAYDHEDLYRIYSFVRRRIEELIYSVRDYEYQQRYFVGVGMGMQVTLEPRWFNADWQWFIGVKKGEVSEQEAREILSPGRLDWKFGSSRQVEILFQRRAEGVQLAPVDRPIRALPARQDWLYYEVRKDTSAWRDVQETQTLAMRLRDSLIVNSDRLQGERQLIVSTHGKNVPLQFALFAVPVQR